MVGAGGSAAPAGFVQLALLLLLLLLLLASKEWERPTADAVLADCILAAAVRGLG
jgi:hypothetical protein